MKTALTKQILSFFVILFLIYSCSEKFDSAKWKPVENGLYGENYRKKMLNDLIDNVLKFPHSNSEKGMKKNDVIELIGKSTTRDCKGYDLYEIEEKTGMIDPNGFVNLKLMYDSDSTLVGYVIENGNYKE